MSEHVDVLIVGAGLSGIGAACHLAKRSPGTAYLIVESRNSIGGTWDLFRYPGVRSDSDMFTLGYRFRPWIGEKSIADGGSILRYVRETAIEYGVDEHIRFGLRVVRAEWSSRDQVWTVDAVRVGTEETVQLTCGFLWTCSGYYRYDEAYSPDLPDVAQFTGRILHPQAWPQGLDYSGKRVVVIGSGATAVTLVPAMAADAEQVTMLQRSPTYVLSLPEVDKFAVTVRARLPSGAAYAVIRWKNILLGLASYQFSRRRPKLMRALIRKGAAAQLPPGYQVDTHFNPTYDPWDQRLCLVPDGDLFRSIRNGNVEVVTSQIERFTETGVRLTSGEEIAADVVVTATGLNLLAFGGLELLVDGQKIHLPDTMAYKGMMLSGVPNFAYVVGYVNASWTLKADLVSEYVCRLLNHMAKHGYQACVPEKDPTVGEEPFLDFAAGYVQRSVQDFPKQGSRAPWRLRANYLRDVLTLRHGSLEDGAMRFEPRGHGGCDGG